MPPKRSLDARPTAPQESSDAALEETASCDDAEAARLMAQAEKKRRGISQGQSGKKRGQEAQEKTKDAGRAAEEEEKVSEDDEPLGRWLFLHIFFAS